MVLLYYRKTWSCNQISSLDYMPLCVSIYMRYVILCVHRELDDLILLSLCITSHKSGTMVRSRRLAAIHHSSIIGFHREKERSRRNILVVSSLSCGTCRPTVAL